MSKSQRRPKKSARRPRVPIAIGVVLVVLALVAGLFAVPFVAKSGSGRAVDVELAGGASDEEVVAKLAAAGVIDRPGLFAFYLRLRGGAQAKAGRHLLADDLSPVEVLRRIRRSPDARKIRVTFPEGFHRWDMAKRLKEKRVCDDGAFLEAARDPALLAELKVGDSVEGWLFPSTYDLPANADPRDVIRRMVSEARARLDKLIAQHRDGASKLQSSLSMGPREILVLASVVEKEAAVDDERPLIASVFLNRLREPASTGGKLQADPTAAYGCLAATPPPASCNAFLVNGGVKVTAEIQHDPENRWSTYTHPGLPPTPISNPGEKSIAAVLSNVSTRWFYFVAKGGGRHTFSETLAAHNSAIKP